MQQSIVVVVVIEEEEKADCENVDKDEGGRKREKVVRPSLIMNGPQCASTSNASQPAQHSGVFYAST
ncbi:hypothetical protein ElyMa_003618500 [Elysia marginata]|uniref:CTNNB1 binding N-teminal domain-containing protein n=1 Tax=Elysia marginata TaxID=1093978 RepID=A0AAV4ESA3_9GAST|nr:hypothetical protein ElyMa_003618500 [Elysia marginata]